MTQQGTQWRNTQTEREIDMPYYNPEDIERWWKRPGMKGAIPIPKEGAVPIQETLEQRKKRREEENEQASREIEEKGMPSSEEVLKEFIPQNDYSNTKEYKSLEKRRQEIGSELDKIDGECRKIKELLNKCTEPKPENEWTDADRISASFLGEKPVKYTAQGEQLNKQYTELLNKSRSLRKEFTLCNDRLEEINNKQAKIEEMNWDKIRPPYVKAKEGKEYQGFTTDRKTVKASFFEDGEGILTEMSPKEYLQRIAYDVFHSTYSSTVSSVNTDNVIKYRKMMENGVKMDLPYLVTAGNKEGAQEGRNRAMAAYLLGIEKIPVLVRKA